MLLDLGKLPIPPGLRLKITKKETDKGSYHWLLSVNVISLKALQLINTETVGWLEVPR